MAWLMRLLSFAWDCSVQGHYPVSDGKGGYFCSKCGAKC